MNTAFFYSPSPWQSYAYDEGMGKTEWLHTLIWNIRKARVENGAGRTAM